jgi:hypothetical protein
MLDEFFKGGRDDERWMKKGKKRGKIFLIKYYKH